MPGYVAYRDCLEVPYFTDSPLIGSPNFLPPNQPTYRIHSSLLVPPTPALHDYTEALVTPSRNIVNTQNHYTVSHCFVSDARLLVRERVRRCVASAVYAQLQLPFRPNSCASPLLAEAASQLLPDVRLATEATRW